MTKAFHVWTHVGPSAYNCVLGQCKGDKSYGIVGYYSTLIPSSMNGQMPCLMALDCAEWALKVTEAIVCYNQMILHSPHRFLRLLTETKIKSISNQRRAKWETALMNPQLTVVADNRTNPASLMENEGSAHDCAEVIICDRGHFVRDEPFSDSLDMFVDDSSFYECDTCYTGWAVVEGETGEVLAEGSLREEVLR